LNLLPNLNTEALVRTLLVKTNDMHMAMYLASLIRTVLALHDFVNNKIRYGEDGTEYKQQDEEEKKEETGKEIKAETSKDKDKKETKKK
jgi:26S proteasome regulatory subunit N8